jgi:hypothetical protein
MHGYTRLYSSCNQQTVGFPLTELPERLEIYQAVPPMYRKEFIETLSWTQI